MKLDALLGDALGETDAAARRVEALGFDGLVVPEVAHDPFLPLTVAAAATSDVRLQTGIAVAFARSPMTVAVTAADLHRFSGGRMVLGLGSQIEAHVRRRFAMPWSRPASRMREFVDAVRAVWEAWETGEKLDFRGDFYELTLMTPMFSHGPSPCGWPTVHVAGVGPAMTAVAGEVADGYLAHGFTTPDYLRDVTMVHLAEGLQRAGRSRSDIQVSVPIMAVVGDDDAALRDGMERVRATISFYGSTPAYRPVLAHHGYEGLGAELHGLSKQGDWARMAQSVPDELVHLMAPVGTAAEVGREVLARFSGIADRLQLGLQASDETTAQLLDALRAGAASSTSANGRGTS